MVFFTVFMTDIRKARVARDKDQLQSDTGSPVQMQSSFSTSEACTFQNATLPALHDLDLEVIESLPQEVLSEIDDMYAGELSRLISKKQGKKADTIKASNISQNIEGMTFSSTCVRMGLTSNCLPKTLCFQIQVPRMRKDSVAHSCLIR